MAASLEKPPLLELIAEIRWNLAASDMAPVTPGMPPIMASNKLDAFYTRFGNAIYADGFQSSERLIPPNMLPFLHAPVCRFRKHEGAPHPALYQIGPGVFTANATPPYKNWEAFLPVVKRGLTALFESREEEEKDAPFSFASLRYIDAFDSTLTQGQETSEFLEKTLGVVLTLPAVMTQLIAPGKTLKPFLQIELPMKNNMQMNVVLGEGNVKGEKVVIMDTTVSISASVSPSVEAVLAILQEAHDSIHAVFFGVTEPIYALMHPSTIERP